MKQTNNAIKFLMAQYRAIFNNAYFKGLATAALVTVAMAAGQANAAGTEFTSGDTYTSDSLAGITGKTPIVTTSKEDTLKHAAKKYINGITVAKDTALTASGSFISADDVTVSGKLTLEKGAQLLLASKQTSGSNNDPIYDKNLTVNSGGAIDLKGNIGLANFNISEATITMASGGTNGTNLTAYGTPVAQDGPQPSGPLPFNAVSTLNKTTATLGDSSNITSIGKLTVSEGTINLNGKVSDFQSHAYNLTYLEGSRNLDISKATLNVSGGSNALSGKNITIDSSKLDLKDATSKLTIGTDYDVKKFATDTNSGTAIAGTIGIKDSTINLVASSELNFGAEGSAASVTFTGTNNITNKGTVNFYTPKISMSAADLNALVESGKVDFKESSVANVAGDLDLTKKVLATTGALSKSSFDIASGKTLKLVSDGTITLGAKFDVANLTLDTDALKVGQGFTQNKGTVTVAKSLSGSKGFTVSSSGADAKFNLVNADTTAATISGIDTLTVKAESNTATLNIQGNWSGLDSAAVVVSSGGTLNLKNVDALSVKSVDVTANGKLTLDGSNLTITNTVKNANPTADETKGVILSNNSSVSASYAKVTESDAIKSDLKNFKLDGTSKIVLTGRTPGEISKNTLNTIKTALLGSSAQGLVEIEGATLSAQDSGITNGTAAFGTAQGNSGLSGIYENTTITGANADVTGSNSWGAVELAQNENNLGIANDGTVTLNGVGGELVSKKDGTTGGVALTQNATLSVKGNGELTTITASANNQGKALVNANLSVTGDIGSTDKALAEVNVQGGQLSTNGNIFANKLVADGAVDTKNITADTITVSDSLTADKITLSGSNKSVTVGNEQDTGFLEVGTLDLAGGKLLLDPAYGDPATIVALKDVTDETKEVVSANGDIGVGQNSILAVGTTADEAKALLTKLDFFNGVSLKQTNGAVLVANESLYIANGKKVVIDSTANHDALDTAITAATGNSFSLGANSALVVTDNLSSKTNDGQKAVIEFQASTGTTLTLAAGSKIAFESALSEKDTVNLSNAATKNDGGVVITAAGGLLEGDYDTTTGKISFTLDEDKLREQAVNMSAPVQDLAIAALKGDGVELGEAGTQYIQTMTGLDGGKAVEETARLAVYGGAVQATNLAQQAATDAVVDRMSRANPNGSLVFADNAQGGGLWLSPVYKSHESDSFDADGVDYGVDADLTGLVLGGDFTSESGVRAGAYFNFGSASMDGQGVGDKVSNDADYFGFGLYAGMTFGQMSLVADAGFTQVSNDIEQTPSAKVSKVKADVDSSAVTLGLRGEYKLSVATMDVTPHLGVRYTRLAVDGYDAKADGYTVATTDVDTMQMFSIPFGVSISKNIVAGSWTVKPVFDLTLTANAGDTDAKLDTTFVGTKTIGLTSEAFDSFTYGATIGIDAKYGENFSVGLNTNYVGSSNTDEFGVMGNVRYMF